MVECGTARDHSAHLFDLLVDLLASASLLQFLRAVLRNGVERHADRNYLESFSFEVVNRQGLGIRSADSPALWDERRVSITLPDSR